ncbi:glycosyltransferase family protein [Paraburkholderia sp. LEh10]|uniref:tetratricopeptide repeat-containing glycosyltransferase family protein n=1 Tax=Paraburkholderia sp. LEh10 TaxID=2821353 RepID=UPI001AE2FE2E|nr:tetratricopeptide repeat-containing glycosyltransferase family protein [Paraburkholderia sp. LEh10]MBP0589338.1 glycosyltransferase family protein [Paraburkholderia sp. LEh10]
MNHDIAQRLADAQQKFTAGQYDDAATLLHGILSIDPDHNEALEALGYVAAKQGDYARAADYALRAAQPAATNPQQLHFAAHICQLAARHADAVALFERVLTVYPDHAESLHGAAMSLVQTGEHERALRHLARLTQRYPQSAEAHYNRGNLLGQMERYDEELAAYRQAIALKPNFVRAYVNLGVALRDLHRFDEALQQFKKALSIDANDAGARTNRAQTNLLLGEFEHGWREYEWRWLDGTMSHGLPDAKLWTGNQSLAHKTVLVHCEQGFGDTLQFIRFVDRLSVMGARVVVRVQEALLPLLHGYPGAEQVIGETAPLPAFDYHIPMLSLAFALKIREPGFVADSPYVHADQPLIDQWDDLFAQGDERLRVGIVWSGSRTHLNDRNRSIPLAQLMPLFDVNAQFVSLVKDVREDDRALLDELSQRGALRDVSGRLASFAETAALITQLDVVICVDTAVAHLAGALGKPVWLALPFTPDWRWQLGRDDSPWYPQMRLFRQTKRNDWSDAVRELQTALAKRA